MEIFGLMIIGGLIYAAVSSKRASSPRPSGPMIMRSDSIEGHYDFLEMHGAITPEENAERRRLEREYREHPERFETMNFKEFAKKHGIEIN